MLRWALIFFVVAIVSMLLGLGGVADAAMTVAWVLFVIAIILLIVGLVAGRRSTSI